MPTGYRDEEFKIPYNILTNEGFSVDVAGLQEGPAIGAMGHKHIPNKQLKNLTEQDFNRYSALIIPGGPHSTKYLWNTGEKYQEKIQSTIKYFHNKNKLVATICYAVLAAVQSGILDNKEIAVAKNNTTETILDKHKIQVSDKSCFTTDNTITAKGPTNAEEFGQAIVEFLKTKK